MPALRGGIDPLALSTAAAWDHWYQRLLANRYRPATIHQHHKTLWGFWHTLGERPAGAATRRDLDRWLNRGLATSTQRTYASTVLLCYRWLHSQRLIRRNPFAGYQLPKVSPGVPRDVELAAVNRLLEQAAADPRDLCMVILAYGEGLRAGEIARARIQDVHLGPDGYLEVDGKGGEQGTVPLGLLAGEFLRGYLTGRPRVGPLIESRNQPGHHVTPATVSARLRGVFHAADIRGTGHALRHTFATQILAAGNGRNIHAVQRLLRHKHLASTQIYVRRYDADAWAAIHLLPDPTTPTKPRRRRRPLPKEATPYGRQVEHPARRPGRGPARPGPHRPDRP